jgi:hypothetical protein
MPGLKSFIQELSLWPSRLRNPHWDGKGAGAALLALVALFYVDKLVLGPWAAVRIHDVFDSDFLRYEPLGNLLFRQGMVSWYPHYAGGMPAYVWHHTPYFLLVVLAGFLPVWLLYAAECMGLMAAAGWGMFRLLTERMGFSARNAFLGAAFFACASQVQINNAPEMIFNCLFPLFYVWTLDVWDNRRQLRLVLKPLAGVGLILMLAYPILTLPYFALLQFALLGLDEKILQDRRKTIGVCVWLGVLWFGYVLTCMPILYALLGYAPEVARRFEHWQMPDVHGFCEFLATLGRQTATTLSRSLTFAPLVAAAGLLGTSARLRKCFWITASVLVMASFFYSPLARLFAGTLIVKMDLAHFFWVVPFAAALAAVVGMDEMVRHPEHEARYWKLLGLGVVMLIALTFAGEVSKRTLAVNLCVASLMLAANRRRFDRLSHVFSGLPNFVRRMGTGLMVVTVLVILICLFRLRPCEAPNLLLFVWLAWLSWKTFADGSAGPRRRTWTLAAMGLLVLFAVRMFRFGGDESENSPYRVAMENYSFLRTLRAQEAGPWRAGAVGSLWPSILVHYGWETVDARGPISNGRYKDVFKRIVRPQLTDKKAEEFFDTYWYDLSLMNGNRKPEFHWPLLALANVKYLVSSEPSPLLENASQSVREEPLDSQVTIRAWADKAGAALPFLQKSLRQKGSLKSYYVYTLKDTLPRGFLVHRAAVLKNDREVLDALSGASIAELKDKVFFSETDTPLDEIRALMPATGDTASRASADTCALTRYLPDRLEYRLSLTSPAALVVSNNYNRHWKVTVNGAAGRVLRADHAFQAVLLPQAGDCHVVLQFKDPWLGITHLGIVAGVLLVASPLAFGLRRGRAAGP